MALPTGLIKSHKGTSQAVGGVKHAAKPSLCLSALTLIQPPVFFPRLLVKIIFPFCERLRFQALTYRLIPIQAESEATSRILFRQVSPAGAGGD